MDVSNYEPFDPAYRNDPEIYYAKLREQAPIHRSPNGYWVVSRYDDVQAIYKDPARFSSSIVGKEAMAQGESGATMQLPDMGDLKVDLIELMATPSIVATDPPKHTEMRRIANRAFMPSRVAQWDSFIQHTVDELLDAARDDGAWDVVAGLSMPLPVNVIAQILGVSDERRLDLKRWSDVIITTGQGASRGTPEGQMQMLQMLKELSDYFMPVIEERRTNPQVDVISDMVRAEEAETLSNLDTLIFIMSLMVAGNETTTNLIGNTIVTLLQNPDQLARLQADPSQVRNAIEESLRFRSPVQFSIRTPTEDLEFAGHRMAKDDPIVIIPASANRDPSRFPEPDRFDVSRNLTEQHFGFGHGIHFCIGFHLARREAATAIGRILPRLHKWKLADAPLERLDSNLVYGFREIRLVPR